MLSSYSHSHKGRPSASCRRRSSLDASERASRDGAPLSPSNSLGIELGTHTCFATFRRFSVRWSPARYSKLPESRSSFAACCAREARKRSGVARGFGRVGRIWRWRAGTRSSIQSSSTGGNARYVHSPGVRSQVAMHPKRVHLPVPSDLRRSRLKRTTHQASYGAACLRM